VLIFILFINSAQAEKIALVIGNANYNNAFIGNQPWRKLSNPVNDAHDMAETLSNLGF